VAVGAWKISPSEFWGMSPQEWWNLEKFYRPPEMVGNMTKEKFDRLKAMLHEEAANG